MARYFIPAAAVPTLLGAYYNLHNRPTEKISTLHEAIEALNSNKDTNEAVSFIENLEDKSYFNKLSPVGLGVLARNGSRICSEVSLRPCVDLNETFEQSLHKFNLGDDWNNGLAWLNRNYCVEDDISCTEDWLVRRPAQVERLRRLMQLLFVKTEQNFDSSLIDIDVIAFLYHVYHHFRNTHKDIAKLVLKTMANLARLDAKFATGTLTSDWLPLLAKLTNNGELLFDRLLAHKIIQNSLYSLGALSYHLKSDLYEMYVSEEPPELDIVLIHGLRGSVEYTWRPKNADKTNLVDCWPRDWLPLDFKKPFRILGLDYPSYLVQFSGSMETLQSRAERFKKQLLDAGVGQRPIAFIGHSLGGLLAKRLLLDLPADVRSKTVGVLFIAVPHQGSPVAAWGYRVLSPTADVVFLHEKSEINKQLSGQFDEVVKEIPVVGSMIELKGSKVFGRVAAIIVPPSSAMFHTGWKYDVDESHFNMCKPESRQSYSYNVIMLFIRDIFWEVEKRKRRQEAFDFSDKIFVDEAGFAEMGVHE